MPGLAYVRFWNLNNRWLGNPSIHALVRIKCLPD